MYQLFYYPGNASMAPHFLLEELGVEYQLMLVDRKTQAQKSAEYLKLNPTGRIPTLVDTQGGSDLVVFESSAICLHLLDKHPDSQLIPDLEDPLRSKFYQWLMYLNNTVQAELMIYFYPDKHTLDASGAQAIASRQEQRLTEMFVLLDSELANKKYLLGDQFTVCDLFLFMLADWADGFSRAPMSMKNLSRTLKLVAQRPSIVQAYKNEGRSLKLYQ
ncbi:MAG: glutathione S-transferase family protein [Pseudomonadales bacterium]|nr:glutathione S-transferase family protein [Pseudomonadales bacterium]NRA17601.1 glutathione S-transferase family protein [Oceanospirillaceae bacterium]